MALSALGWSSFFESQLDARERELFQPARVIGVHRDLFRVATGERELDAELRGKLRNADLVAAGDFVLISASGDRAVIERVLDRRTKLSRKIAGRVTEEQVLAANLDAAWIVMALDADFSVRRLERYLILVREGGARPVIVLSKADLAGAEAGARVAEVARVALDAAVYAISALTGDGVATLVERELEPGMTIALVGSSGVGKSTLTNLFAAGEVQRTRPVRESDGTGRHTTTARELIVLPNGALLLDSPGLREVQLWDGSEGLESTFGDLTALAGGCRFSDCTHAHEPGCAVRAAIESGELESDRLDDYHALRRELAYLERKQDVHARNEEKRRWKIIHKAQRERYKRR